MSDTPHSIDFDSDQPVCIWITGREAGMHLDALQTLIWERVAAAPSSIHPDSGRDTKWLDPYKGRDKDRWPE